MPSRKDAYCETEIKLVINDVPELLRQLEALGATPEGRVLERNTVFDTDGADLRHRGRLLRLRTEVPASSAFAAAGPARTTLTAKSPVPPGSERGQGSRNRGRGDLYKRNFEREVHVQDPVPPAPATRRKRLDRGWGFALGCLGLRSSFRYEKYRTSFRVKDLHVSLDETPLGVFVELEGKPAAIDSLARALGFAPRDYIRATYYDIYAAARRRHGRVVNDMLFPS